MFLLIVVLVISGVINTEMSTVNYYHSSTITGMVTVLTVTLPGHHGIL